MDGLRKARLVWNDMKGVGEEHVVNRVPYNLCDVVGVGLDKPAIGRTAAFANPTFAAPSSAASMSMAMTLRAILDNGNVNQPSPEHRSTTSMPGVTPTSLSTLAGSGDSASHQPGSGIPVRSKNPGSWLVISSLLLARLRRFAGYVTALGMRRLDAELFPILNPGFRRDRIIPLVLRGLSIRIAFLRSRLCPLRTGPERL